MTAFPLAIELAKIPEFVLQDLVGMSSEAVALGSFPVVSPADVSLERLWEVDIQVSVDCRPIVHSMEIGLRVDGAGSH